MSHVKLCVTIYNTWFRASSTFYEGTSIVSKNCIACLFFWYFRNRHSRNGVFLLNLLFCRFYNFQRRSVLLIANVTRLQPFIFHKMLPLSSASGLGSHKAVPVVIGFPCSILDYCISLPETDNGFRCSALISIACTFRFLKYMLSEVLQCPMSEIIPLNGVGICLLHNV